LPIAPISFFASQKEMEDNFEIVYLTQTPFFRMVGFFVKNWLPSFFNLEIGEHSSFLVNNWKNSNTLQFLNSYDAVFYRTNHKFENMVIFRSGNLYSLCNPGNYLFFLHFFIKPGEQSSIILIKMQVLHNATISPFRPFWLKLNNLLIILVSWATKWL